MIQLRIKEICKDKGITLNKLAEEIGISQPSISGIVTGKIKPSLETIEKISNALNVNPSELFEKPSEHSFTCPNCGASLKISKDE